MSSREWRELTLGEVLNFRRGHDLTKKDMTFGKYPVVGSNGVIGYHNDYTTEDPCVSIGRSGNVGKPHILKQKCWAHNTTLYVDDFKGNEPGFIFYMLQTLNLENYRGGSAVPTLNRNHIHPIKLKIPYEINEQKAIAHILSILDEKIEVNNQINKTLENMAQAIFKQWFVDFEFPNEAGVPYKSSGGEMVESELGMIPEGWEVGAFTDNIQILSGGTPKTNNEEYWNGVIPFFTPKDSNGLYSFQTEKNITKVGLSKCNSKLYEKNTVFITARGTVGKVAMSGVEMAMNQSCYALVGNNAFNQYFVYFKVLQAVEELQKNATGSVFNSIVVSTFDALKIVKPQKKELSLFYDLVRPIFDYIHNNSIQIIELIKIRDTLLPKLMSGEIRVPLDSEGEAL